MSTTKNCITLPPHEITSRAAAILAGNAAGDRSRIHAFNKAAFMLAREAVEIVHSFDGFLITSATRAGVVHRVSHLHGCSCEAATNGRYCWHAAVVEVLEESGKHTRPTMPRLARSEAHAKALAEINELF